MYSSQLLTILDTNSLFPWPGPAGIVIIGILSQIKKELETAENKSLIDLARAKKGNYSNYYITDYVEIINQLQRNKIKRCTDYYKKKLK